MMGDMCPTTCYRMRTVNEGSAGPSDLVRVHPWPWKGYFAGLHQNWNLESGIAFAHSARSTTVRFLLFLFSCCLATCCLNRSLAARMDERVVHQ